LGERRGGMAGRLRDRVRGDFARFEGIDADAFERRAAAGPETRAIDIGDAAEVWAPFVAPAVGLDHLGAETILVLDEPADLADAGEVLWNQADERRRGL